MYGTLFHQKIYEEDKYNVPWMMGTDLPCSSNLENCKQNYVIKKEGILNRKNIGLIRGNTSVQF